MPRNSFKLLQYVGLDGGTNHYIAYFITSAAGQPAAIGAGFVEVEVKPHSFSVADQQNGFVFSSDTLDDFIAGIEKTSGCRFRPDADLLPLLGRPPRGRLAAVEERNLFIREEAARDTLAPHAVPAVDHGLNFFAPVAFSFLDGLVSGHLYRKCFTTIGGSVIFVDAQGVSGTLRLAATHPADGGYQLLEHHGIEAQFIREHGLEVGARYATDELVHILENYGMTWLAYEDEVQAVPDDALDFFQLGQVPLQPTSVALQTGQSRVYPEPAPGQPRRRTFWFDGTQLHYVARHGQRGSVLFQDNGAPGGNLSLAPRNHGAERDFARANGIEEGRQYTTEELTWLLHGSGYVRDSEREAATAVPGSTPTSTPATLPPGPTIARG